eukprot:COSAG02_NODE_59469_length_274_cov_0.594286_1_plen_31_part_10
MQQNVAMHTGKQPTMQSSVQLPSQLQLLGTQ